LLAQVHPDLAKVMRTAAEASPPLVMDYGVRIGQAEHQAVATGHSRQ
jgi:hypothetical protein